MLAGLRSPYLDSDTIQGHNWVAPTVLATLRRTVPLFVVEVHFMTTTPDRGDSATPPLPSEFVIKRDNDRPLSFSGILLGEACLKLGFVHEATVCAAIYRTAGGKHVATLTRAPAGLDVALRAFGSAGLDEEPEQPATSGRFNKAAVCNNFEEALAWFRPGRVTDALRDKLGLNVPERID